MERVTQKEELDAAGMIADIGIDARCFPANLAGLVDHSAESVVPIANRNGRPDRGDDASPDKGKDARHDEDSNKFHHQEELYHLFFFPAINCMLSGLLE